MAQVIRSCVIYLRRAHSTRCSIFPAFRYYSSDGNNFGKTADSSSNSDSDLKTTEAVTPMSGLEKTFDMFHRVDESAMTRASSITPPKPISFAAMLRRSKLMHIGDPEGSVVVGTIVETLNDDLYIDFGGKFDCVCKKPRTRADEYRRGAKVRVRLHDLEMSSRFLGARRDITLLEADATLVGLHREQRDVVHSAGANVSSRTKADVQSS